MSRRKIHETHNFSCQHRAYAVDSNLRRVVCADKCNEELDPIQVLIDLTRRDGYAETREVEARKTAARVAFLKGEERRVKARLKNANRKDADHAVQEERKRWIERLRRVQRQAANADCELSRLRETLKSAGIDEQEPL